MFYLGTVNAHQKNKIQWIPHEVACWCRVQIVISSTPTEVNFLQLSHHSPCLYLLIYLKRRYIIGYFFPMAQQPLGGLGRLIFRRFTITLFRHTTFGRTPLDEGPARRRDLYLTTHNTHTRQTSMLPVGFFFFACPGFVLPFDPFLYCLNPIVLHVTLRSILQQTQHKHPCPRWDSNPRS
jgi:hypothetical protein